MFLLFLFAAEPQITPILPPAWTISTWNQTTFVQSGAAFEVTMGEAWAGFAFDAKSEQDADAIVFQLDADETAWDALAIYLDNGSERVRIKALAPGLFKDRADHGEGSWSLVRAPLAKLNSTNAPWARIVFFNASRKGGVKFKVSGLRLEHTPKPPVAARTIMVSIDATKRTHVSPYIYGDNQVTAGMRFLRLGGNRWSTYNWKNNASNAGIDYGPNSNDAHLSPVSTPLEPMKRFVQIAKAQKAQPLVTIPMLDWVAADKDGVVRQPQGRFVRNSPEYQAPVVEQVDAWYSLDNEPGLWSSTHPLVHPEPATYAEMAQRSKSFSDMIRSKRPNATIFFGVCYGWNEYVNLQNATDARGRDYLDYLLGLKVGDVLDVHWYPEVKEGGRKIIDSQGASDARVQAPRSLWDASYAEQSWIKGPVRLIPLLKEKIAKHAPGTKLAITEYNYGGGNHISGALAQADVLGIFGREGVFAAALWAYGFQESDSYVHAAFKMFNGVGDVQLGVSGVPADVASVYAFDRGVVVINKTKAPLKVEGISLAGRKLVLDGSSRAPRVTTDDVLPPLSILTSLKE